MNGIIVIFITADESLVEQIGASNMSQHRQNFLALRLLSRGLVPLLAMILLLGIFFRVTNLAQQVYWHDEAYTSLRISGYQSNEVNASLFNGKVSEIAELQKYQKPSAEKGILDTVKSLAFDDTQHPPLYYVLIRLWVQYFGSSIQVIRSFSALIGILVIPCIAWLSWELWGADNHRTTSQQPLLACGLASALVALSPFYVLYAQEAREYALWAVLILLFSTFLLRAIRLNTLRSWGLYAGFLTLGFYTQPLTLVLAIGHGFYLLFLNRGRWHRTAFPFLASCSLALLLFAPWLSLILKNWSTSGANWTSVPLPLPILLKTWGLHLERAFLLTAGDFGFDTWQSYLSLPPLLVLLFFGCFYLIRYNPIRIWLFVFTLMGSVALPLGLADLLLGGQRSTSGRYLVPFYLGLFLAIAHLLAHQISSHQWVRQKVGQGVAAILLTVSLFACYSNSQADSAWTKGINYNLPSVASIINTAPQPLVISNSFGINFGTIFALSYRLNKSIKYQLVDGWLTSDYQNIPQPPKVFQSLFLLNPSDQFRQKLEQQQGEKTTLVFNDSHLFLWKMPRGYLKNL
jgi:uncharacterized membrane protein